jgi:hypothetical protein
MNLLSYDDAFCSSFKTFRKEWTDYFSVFMVEMSHGEVKKFDINKYNIYTYVLLNNNFEKILKY